LLHFKRYVNVLFMSQSNEKKSGEPVDGCLFPTGPDGQICGRPIASNGKPVGGRRSSYCDNPDHTRGKAFAVRRRYELDVARGHNSTQHEVAHVEHAVSEHPVTDGRISLAALLARLEDSSMQLATILNRAIEVVRTVSDPDAASYEVEQIQRQAAIQVADAQRAQAAAQHDASNARKQAAREAEQRAQADEAAEHALRQISQMQVELEKARNVVTHAEAEKEAAQQATERDRTTIQSLRRQLEQQRQDLNTLRQQAQDERAALAQHYTDQIAAILATIHQANKSTQVKPATTPKLNTTARTTRKSGKN
jgi:colicin import membrane protein